MQLAASRSPRSRPPKRAGGSSIRQAATRTLTRADSREYHQDRPHLRTMHLAPLRQGLNRAFQGLPGLGGDAPYDLCGWLLLMAPVATSVRPSRLAVKPRWHDRQRPRCPSPATRQRSPPPIPVASAACGPRTRSLAALALDAADQSDALKRRIRQTRRYPALAPRIRRSGPRG